MNRGTYTTTLTTMRSTPRVLLLGGSTEASDLGRLLGARSDVHVVFSLAGRTQNRPVLGHEQRVGGFGGPSALASYLEDNEIGAVLDATHPFAARMPGNTATACAATGTPRLRVVRPPWIEQPDDTWQRVPKLDAAASAVEGAGRVFLTTGRQELQPFASVRGAWFLVRAIEPPDPQPIRDALVILDRGPFTLDGERALLREHRIDVIVAKNSGGNATAAKLVAARELQRPVVMIDRPPTPDGPTVATADEAIAWLDALLTS